MKTKSKRENVVNNRIPPTGEHLIHHLWVQYGHEDEKTAPVIQTANSEQEARNEDETVMSGCCWYRYDIAPGGRLINGSGPHYLTSVKVHTPLPARADDETGVKP